MSISRDLIQIAEETCVELADKRICTHSREEREFCSTENLFCANVIKHMPKREHIYIKGVYRECLS